jgi:hypothetical protein
MVTAENNDSSKSARKVLRPISGYWLAGTLTAIVLFFGIDALVRLDFGYLLTALPWQLLAIWVLYVLLVRPCVVLVPEHLRVINLFRRHDIAWAEIDRFGGRYQLIVFLRDGKKIACWGAPSTGLDRRIANDMSASAGYASSRLRGRRSRRTTGAATVDIVRDAMNDLSIDTSSGQSAALSSAQPSVVTTIEKRVLVISAVLVVLCVADGLVTALAH